jgi:hypothetical protein
MLAEPILHIFGITNTGFSKKKARYPQKVKFNYDCLKMPSVNISPIDMTVLVKTFLDRMMDENYQIRPMMSSVARFFHCLYCVYTLYRAIERPIELDRLNEIKRYIPNGY